MPRETDWMMAARTVFPILLVSWRRWKIAVSTPSRATPVILSDRTVIPWDLIKSWVTEYRSIKKAQRINGFYHGFFVLTYFPT